ncbi:MAG: electron transfer flavoprotein subunit beta/FixA family protein [Actinobacteria bacterium]|nr:electron transfer flavoprotein subunit beta/FixA family protein [Actinomycetota bacterium]
MNIVIPIKQVPETSNVKMDEETGTMIREGVESIINPLDLYAIEVGIELKEEHGGKVTVITMGPQSAEKALREAIAMGCDDGILITGKEFKGSDTWATSFVLSSAIRKIGTYDLILAGERATDGDTGQVGPGIASFLNIPLSTYTSRIVEITDNTIIVERLIEDGYETLQMPLPCLLTVVKEISYPRLPTLRGKQKAKKVEIPVWSADDMDLDKSKIGLNGSPTRVVRISHPRIARGGTIVKATDEESLSRAIDKLINFLQEKNLI